MTSLAFALSFRGSLSHAQIRDALGDALTATGAPPGAWETESLTSLADANCAGGCFEGRWRRGDATLAMSCANGDGNPRDGYGYDHRVELAWGDRALRWNGGATSSAVDDFCPRLTGSPADFRAVRAALAARLGGDATDHPTWAGCNLRALEGIDLELQRELLRAALARGPSTDYAWRELLAWKERLLGGSLEERLRGAPADLDAWERASSAPPPGWDASRIDAVRARLAPWDPAVAGDGVARAWNTLPALARGEAHPPGWWQLDEGYGPGWPWASLVATFIKELFGREGLAVAMDGPARVVKPSETVQGCGYARAVWTSAPLPRVHARFELSRGFDPAEKTFVDWVWGDGEGDVAAIVREERARVVLGVGMYLSGGEGFQREVIRAMHAAAPFAWRAVDALFVEREVRRRVGGEVTRDEVRAELEVQGVATPALREALGACRCERAPCAHREAVRAALGEARVRRAGPWDLRSSYLAQAREATLDAALAVLDGTSRAAERLGRARALRAVADAIVPAPVTPRTG